jgi:hypothetical protein
MTTNFRRAWLFVFAILSAQAGPLEAADRNTATLLVKDALTSPNQPVTVEARLVATGLLTQTGLGGEPVELVADGNVSATAMTGGDGRALLTVTSKARGVVPVRVRVGASPRIASTEGQANLAVWEKRQPIIVVELAALMEDVRAQGPLPGVGLVIQSERKPMPDAAEELGKLTQFYYRVIYVVPSATVEADPFRANVEAREWLQANKFPSGYVVVLPPGESALGAKIDEMHAAGWKTVKTGIGRSKAFAEAFLQRRLDAMIVPEPSTSEVPRKAKVAKGWKEIRKKL